MRIRFVGMLLAPIVLVLVMPVCVVRVAVMPVASRLQHDNAPGQGYAEHERDRELEAIVAMELQFRQQVAGGDAHESPGSEPKQPPQQHLVVRPAPSKPTRRAERPGRKPR